MPKHARKMSWFGLFLHEVAGFFRVSAGRHRSHGLSTMAWTARLRATSEC